MSASRIGSLCSGYEGLGMAVQAVIPDAELAWVSDIDKGACKVLAHRYPDVPNLGDMTAVDWATVEPIDILTGGTPCQDLSHAGKRAGMTAGTRSNLWVAMREAIAVLRPSLVIWENVGGAYSAAADSDMERAEGLLGGGTGRPALRALGRVLGDLASLGFDAEWHGIRAADVGAPHGRLRVFVAAYPKGHAGRFLNRDGCLVADALGGGRDGWTRDEGRGTLGRAVAGGDSASGSGGLDGPLLPTPRTSDTNGAGAHGEGGVDLRTAVSLLPTPAVNDMGEGKTVEAWDEWTAKMQAAHGNGNGHGKPLAIEAQRLDPHHGANSRASWAQRPDAGDPSVALLPTLRVKNNENRQSDAFGGETGNFYGLLHGAEQWGDYADAIARWEALTRPAPAPTQPSKKGTPQLSARFSEWLMGLPDGWITDVPGITRNEALKLAGNGVVWQQAAAALRIMLARAEDVAA